MEGVNQILHKGVWSHDDLVLLLNLKGKDQKDLFDLSASVKEKTVGNKIYFRGLIELSNICLKDCLYCGIRRSNENTNRYNLTDEEVLNAAVYAFEQKYASVVLQSGELESPAFTKRILRLLKKIHQQTNYSLRVTLSLGEQTEDTYKQWFEAGAQRYLLRIESSSPELYRKIHPADGNHDFSKRLFALETLKKLGYQTGTGVMIGLPFQTVDNLADDLIFMKNFEIDMVGMGPYIEHADTPLYQYRNELLPIADRLDLALRMIACLRILMPRINIAAPTALQAIDKMGREKAIRIGANVIMPNITPGKYRNDYRLYENKPCTDENADDCTSCLKARIGMTGNEVAFGEWGDSLFYKGKIKRKPDDEGADELRSR
jgi:biotin synthase